MALMALREGLPSNMLYAYGASTMRNFVLVVAWHGGSSRVSTSYTDPRGNTLSLENPLKWVFTGSSFSLPMPILSNADVKMMVITSGLSWGCWQPSMSASRRLWWYPIEGAWTRPEPLESPLI